MIEHCVLLPYETIGHSSVTIFEKAVFSHSTARIDHAIGNNRQIRIEDLVRWIFFKQKRYASGISEPLISEKTPAPAAYRELFLRQWKAASAVSTDAAQ